MASDISTRHWSQSDLWWLQDRGHHHGFRQQHRPWTLVTWATDINTDPGYSQTTEPDVALGGNMNPDTAMSSGGSAGHFQFSLQMSNIPLCVYTTFTLSIPSVMDIQAVSVSWLLLDRAAMNMCLWAEKESPLWICQDYIAGLYGRSNSSFWSNLPTDFHSCYASFQSHYLWIMCPFPTSRSEFLSTVLLILAILVWVKWNLKIGLSVYFKILFLWWLWTLSI